MSSARYLAEYLSASSGPALTCTPANGLGFARASEAGQVVNIVGSGTSFTGSTVFTVSAGSITNKVVTDGTHASITYSGPALAQTITVTETVTGSVAGTFSVNVGSFTVSPNDIYTGAGNHTLTLAGAATDWVAVAATFAVSAGATKVSQNITTNTAATLVVNIGGSPTTIVVSDGVSSQTFTVGTPTISPSPTSISANTSSNVISLSGLHTLWQIDAPTFSLSGGTGASITAQSIAGNNSATVTLTAGSAAGTLTITDPSTGATTTVAVTAVGAATKAVMIASPFYSTDSAPVGYQLYKWSGGSLVTAGSRVTTGILATGATNGAVASATLTLDADGGYRGLAVWDTNGGSPPYMLGDEINVPPRPVGGAGPVGHSGGIAITLVDASGNPRANLTGLRWSWFDQSRPDLFARPTETGGGQATNASGVLTIALTNTMLTSGQVGFLVVSDTDGTTSMSHKAFSGPVALS